VHANPRADRRLRVSIATGHPIRVIHLDPRSPVNPGRLVEHAQRKVVGAFAAYGSFWSRFLWFMPARVDSCPLGQRTVFPPMCGNRLRHSIP
jgi:hypothetical protein